MSDRFPFVATLKANLAKFSPLASPRTDVEVPHRPNWTKLSKEEIIDIMFTIPLEARLSSLPSLELSDSCPVSAQKIEEFVNDISSLLLDVAKENILPKRYYRH